MEKIIKVLVVDDSAFMRRVISDIISNDKRLAVAGVATNGQEALDMIESLKPDVVTLDIEMPVLDGLEALRRLQKRGMIPVIMLSTLAKEGARETILSLELGALDFITKPENIFGMKSEEIKNDLIEKILIASTVKFDKIRTVISRPTPVVTHEPSVVLPKRSVNGEQSKVTNILAIGVSTGGPKALQRVIPFLPQNINAGVVLVQHMPPSFTKSLAERLDQNSQVSVKEAEHRDLIKNGWVYVAPGDKHLLVKEEGGNYYIELSDEPKRGGHKPAVNTMLESMLTMKVNKLVGVIMTGMGADGTEGFEALKGQRKNIQIIAQDEPSCVVYGMPKAVVQKGIADSIVTLDDIPKEIIKYTGVL